MCHMFFDLCDDTENCDTETKLNKEINTCVCTKLTETNKENGK